MSPLIAFAAATSGVVYPGTLTLLDDATGAAEAVADAADVALVEPVVAVDVQPATSNTAAQLNQNNPRICSLPVAGILVACAPTPSRLRPAPSRRSSISPTGASSSSTPRGTGC